MDTSVNGKTIVNDKMDIDLRRFLKVVKKRFLLIILLTLGILIGVGLINFFVLSPVYEAKTLLMVTVASEKLQTQTTMTRPVTQNNQGSTTTNMAPMPVLTMNTYLGQLKSEVVMSRVLASVNIPGLKIGSLSEMIEANIVKDSNLIEVVVTNTNPNTAAQIANAVSAQYLKLMDELMFSSVVVISPASVPENPVAPNKILNMIIALIVGFTGSVLLAFILEYLDNTLKTPEDVARELDLPVLGMIPVGTAKSI